ncbi:reverse transcriptase domain-containing protein [Saccharopolyspora sp. ASAGF58]|uniref:reverse transcriptase domain-containing protein n=1 Tax=Saccharopolyspora sp. ASAGF58 TaxID=2719023 RepID=UPI001B3039F2
MPSNHGCVNALKPEWEARLDPEQYGFSPDPRGCHDAIEMIHRVIAVKNTQREWALDADLKSAFDKIDHKFSGASNLAGHGPGTVTLLVTLRVRRRWFSGCGSRRRCGQRV